jgi:hypothetical protein
LRFNDNEGPLDPNGFSFDATNLQGGKPNDDGLALV